MNIYIDKQTIKNAIDIAAKITEETNLELSVYLDCFGLKSIDNQYEYSVKYYSILNKFNKLCRKQYTYRYIW